ncbi:maltose alpha-D-glucosyltransferase [Fundidesulfovibrio soli]|uniref:maltose alpha-D-glucosyltransferase n=1 Tax=Fundidesulfovibrio soli TaxID=2922716 RepID=UPI001FAE808B|nr:maltose alpha-D-glucosyltransferase [Fundidesulfovibrio soli]
MWYKDTIIYELHVRSFADSDGDGIGDFNGLTSRLGYLERLGVGALWLLPFYPSPLRDDGYDIADYTHIHPDYGTMADFRRFLREAHERGFKVITELVLNHTSDQHPWFQRARRAKPGSKARDFYVWSETPDKYRDARIIFKDFEQSNWAWDPVAKAYYWHRFYSHQPDLNFDNPSVRKAVFKVLDFWLDMGVDGLRLDAVPYLFERRGTNCENLPETHAFLKELRAYVDAKYPGRMLLAEANQWPEDAVNYFGKGDECHMAFHFPVMPRIFMSLWTEDRYPIIDILEQTPDIPANCQWAIFLRNHDELTLEMVTDEERDYMYRAYASDAKARINLGIRRRLAPLMQNNRRRMEVINFLLFSFPGTPIIYYGDELGMGDNYHLGDRNGVRTPMQWSPDRNAGFSKANPQKLYLPVVIDPEYHYEVVNVETQERNQTSLFWWMRRIIAMYKSLPALGQGTLEFVRGENTRVLSFLRIHEDQRLLVLVNLSRYAQVDTLDLSHMAGSTPVEVFGQSRFPQIEQSPYTVILGPHDHFWLLLEDVSAKSCPMQPKSLGKLFLDRGVPSLDELNAELGKVLPMLLAPSGAAVSTSAFYEEANIVESLHLGGGEFIPIMALVEGRHRQNHLSTHLAMPVAVRGGALQETEAHLASGLLGRSEHRGETAGLANGFENARAMSVLAELVLSGQEKHAQHGVFSSELYIPRKERSALTVQADTCRLVLDTRHSVCWTLGDQGFLKVFRELGEGVNPELEMLRALDRQDFPGVPRLTASLTYKRRRGKGFTLAVIEEYFQGAEDGQSFVAQALEQMSERALASGVEPLDVSALPVFTPPELGKGQREVIGEYTLDFFRRLGVRTAQLHESLAGVPGQAFQPEPFNKLYLRSCYQSMRNTAHQANNVMLTHRSNPAEEAKPFPLDVVLRRFAKVTHLTPSGLRIRIHGDFQMNNILHRGRDLFIVDFDGDDSLPLGERVIKRSPLRDVASLLVSIGALVAGWKRRQSGLLTADSDRLGAWIALWRRSVAHCYLQAYLETCGDGPLLPATREDTHTLLEVFLLEQLLRHIIRDSEGAGDEFEDLMYMLHAYLKVFP